MTRASDWLDAYLRAWTTKKPKHVRAVFTDDAEYWFRPDDPAPVTGIDAILEMWARDDEPCEPRIDLRVLVESPEIAVITGSVDYPGHQTYLNMWEVHLAEDGRARRFVEWFMTPRKRGA
ncbi:nuclear transport factor 2 family protein [Microbacterium sp. SORGH_AS_0888]|uniref:nuclear transport factor 2 family protein n=1 Tax=Microbacterium sp. SORGH_AS_0888 TaxID=3041791 RepID=UPI0027802637|nr:nuclear transport factor 2 family protein [Microbacterium sp. SORGH_AS_0888]MDQ1130825.1 hypothetical protein [Microbacterium sp. SORGH_AS_0888]